MSLLCAAAHCTNTHHIFGQGKKQGLKRATLPKDKHGKPVEAFVLENDLPRWDDRTWMGLVPMLSSSNTT